MDKKCSKIQFEKIYEKISTCRNNLEGEDQNGA